MTLACILYYSVQVKDINKAAMKFYATETYLEAEGELFREFCLKSKSPDYCSKLKLSLFSKKTKLRSKDYPVTATDFLNKKRSDPDSFNSYDSYPHFLKAKKKMHRNLEKLYKEKGALSATNTGFIRVIRAQFSHGSISHLLGNLFMLLVFGAYVESRLGSLEYSALYLIGGTAGIYGHAAFFMEEGTYLVGASANVMAVMGAFYVLFFRHKLKFWVFYFISKVVSFPIKYIFPFFFIAGDLVNHVAGLSNVASMAHLIGLASGVGLALLKKSTENFSWPFIYQYEWREFRSAKKSSNATNAIQKLSEILSYNPENYIARSYLIKLIFKKIHETKKITRAEYTTLTKYLQIEINQALKNDHASKSLEIIRKVPINLKFDKFLDQLPQQKILILGDMALDANHPILALRIYLSFIGLFPKAKNSVNLCKTIESILNSKFSDSEYAKIEIVFNSYGDSFLIKKIYSTLNSKTNITKEAA